MARALIPVNETTKRFSFRYTSIGMISHAVKTKGVRRRRIGPGVLDTDPLSLDVVELFTKACLSTTDR
jgi:hypothetical protein